jgi:hypothetical protein
MNFSKCHKGKFYRLDTHYYIKLICKLKIPTKWTQISEINFFVLFTFKYLQYKKSFLIKYGLCNLDNSKVEVHQEKNGLDLLLIMELKILPEFWDNVIIWRVMTLRNNIFGKYEICDGILKFLVVCINFLFYFYSITYTKGYFHDQY